MLRSTLCLAALLASATSTLAAPRVVTDIAPIHSLTAIVMGELGEPALLVPAGVSPHNHTLRPSEASALQEADLVIWVGEGLTPWLVRSLETLAGDAEKIGLLEAPGGERHEFRENALFETEEDEHGHGEVHHDKDEHEEHAEKEKDHDEHGHDEHGHDEHDHGSVDPHAWLDPEVGAIWLDLIADTLGRLDPENRATYEANAQNGANTIAGVTAEISASLIPTEAAPFIVFHDAYHYFEHRFGLEAAGAISLGDATRPSAARIRILQEAIGELGNVCVFSEPQFDRRAIDAAIGGAEARIAELDPLGVNLSIGPELYPELIRQMGKSMAGCL